MELILKKSFKKTIFSISSLEHGLAVNNVVVTCDACLQAEENHFSY
jgi:hypothetical protein